MAFRKKRNFYHRVWAANPMKSRIRIYEIRQKIDNFEVLRCLML